jgi:hypothetical protein
MSLWRVGTGLDFDGSPFVPDPTGSLSNGGTGAAISWGLFIGVALFKPRPPLFVASGVITTGFCAVMGG